MNSNTQRQQQLPLCYMNNTTNNNTNTNNSFMAYSPTNNAKRGSRSQDRLMPIANVIRIMRKVLPAHAKIADDAKESIQECVSEFISFVTSEANDRCQREQRKTITAEDVLWAMSKLGFDDYYGPLCLYLQRYREIEGDQKGSIRGEPLPVPLSMLKKDPSLAISTSTYNNEPGTMAATTYQNGGGSRSNGGMCNPSLGYYTDMSNAAASMPVGSYSQYKI